MIDIKVLGNVKSWENLVKLKEWLPRVFYKGRAYDFVADYEAGNLWPRLLEPRRISFDWISGVDTKENSPFVFLL